MIFDLIDDLNWLAIAVATLAWFAFSAIWYAQPVLGRQWQRATGVTVPEGYRPGPTTFITTLIGYFVIAALIAMLTAGLGAADVVDAIALGVALGVGFNLAESLVRSQYEQKPTAYWLIVGIHGVIAYSIVAVIVTLWD